LIRKKNNNIKANIQPINYFCSLKNLQELKILLNKDTNLSHEINICLVNLGYNPLNELHDGWFVNLSGKNIRRK